MTAGRAPGRSQAGPHPLGGSSDVSVGRGAPLVEVKGLAKTFDVSAPWLNRVLERQPKRFVHAVDGVDFAIRPHPWHG